MTPESTGDLEELTERVLELARQRGGVSDAEAYASRKPVITLSDSGGPTELVKDGETGFICPVSPEALAAKLDVLAGQADQAAKMGEKGYHTTAHINWETVVGRFLAVMNDG